MVRAPTFGYGYSDHGFPRGFSGRESPDNAGDAGDIGLIPWSRRYAGEGNGNPFQYSYLGNPMDRGALRATVHIGLQRVGHN